MTELKLYESALIEQNKLEAPTLLIEEFNYLINKAILQYTNLNYAKYEINQQSSDDLRWLQRSVELEVKTKDNGIKPGEEECWYVDIPTADISGEYLHALGCTVEFEGTISSNKCNNSTLDSYALCRRITSDQFPAVIQNAYLKPTYKRPYFFIQPDEGKIYILCGKGATPKKVYLDYLKTPEKINLTWDEVQGIAEDSSKKCEFPDAVAYEIINIFVKLILENASDPRMQTQYAVNQTVGEPQVPEKK